jgi:hypothetical protein
MRGNEDPNSLNLSIQWMSAAVFLRERVTIRYKALRNKRLRREKYCVRNQTLGVQITAVTSLTEFGSL